MWVLPWLAGLCLISWLGSFPALSKGAGNLGVIDFNFGFLATGLLTVLVMWLAQCYRLPAQTVAELVPDDEESHGKTTAERTA